MPRARVNKHTTSLVLGQKLADAFVVAGSILAHEKYLVIDVCVCGLCLLYVLSKPPTEGFNPTGAFERDLL